MHCVIGCHPESDAILGAGFLPIVVGSSLAWAASGRTVKYAEAFELCEYGRQAPADELKKMFVP